MPSQKLTKKIGPSEQNTWQTPCRIGRIIKRQQQAKSTTNSSPQKQLAQVTATVGAIVKENAKLLNMLVKNQNLKQNKEKNSGAKISSNTNKYIEQMPDQQFKPRGYCYTCGYKVTWGHTSKNCKQKRHKNHKEEATLKNKMGGSTKYKNWWKKSNYWKDM